MTNSEDQIDKILRHLQCGIDSKELIEVLRSYGNKRFEEGVKKSIAKFSCFESLYSTNSLWHGFKWSPETETKMLQAVEELRDKILSLLPKEKE